MVEMRNRMIDILVRSTGQDPERITADIDRDYILRGQAAVDYGLVDEVVEFRELRPVHDELAIAR
jgi:ATP-dependent Clp protease protease subunit